MRIPIRKFVTQGLRAPPWSARASEMLPLLLIPLPLAYWLAGMNGLLGFALGAGPVLLIHAGVATWRKGVSRPARLIARLQRHLARQHRQADERRQVACLILAIDDYARIEGYFGHGAARAVSAVCLMRLRRALRARDFACVIAPGRLAVVPAPSGRLGHDICVALGRRLQEVVLAPVPLDRNRGTVRVSASLGFARSGQFKRPDGLTLARAAMRALDAASWQGPGALRAYAPDLPAPLVLKDGQAARAAAAALENGQIRPWFQPQIGTDTGRLTGVEALARWQDPARGLIPPAEFLPLIAQAGRMTRLGDVMVKATLGALRAWDERGIEVPRAAVNFAPEDLQDPDLAGRTEWELDRQGIAPTRLAIEVLEDVVASSPSDTVVRNLDALVALGCPVELDDFGTGAGAISTLRRLPVSRVKIDRSFVTGVDRDPEQQRMVAAILALAQRLGLDVIAEGVETAGEHTILAQLGCRHVQGFGIARPMPGDALSGWIAAQAARLPAPPQIGRFAG